MGKQETESGTPVFHVLRRKRVRSRESGSDSEEARYSDFAVVVGAGGVCNYLKSNLVSRQTDPNFRQRGRPT
jgi:hypothetical protein